MDTYPPYPKKEQELALIRRLDDASPKPAIRSAIEEDKLAELRALLCKIEETRDIACIFVEYEAPRDLVGFKDFIDADNAAACYMKAWAKRHMSPKYQEIYERYHDQALRGDLDKQGLAASYFHDHEKNMPAPGDICTFHEEGCHRYGSVVSIHKNLNLSVKPLHHVGLLFRDCGFIFCFPFDCEKTITIYAKENPLERGTKKWEKNNISVYFFLANL